MSEKCRNCDATLADSAKFCNACGTKVESNDAGGSLLKCPYCAEQIRKDVTLCRFCRSELAPSRVTKSRLFEHQKKKEFNRLPILVAVIGCGIVFILYFCVPSVMSRLAESSPKDAVSNPNPMPQPTPAPTPHPMSSPVTEPKDGEREQGAVYNPEGSYVAHLKTLSLPELVAEYIDSPCDSRQRALVEQVIIMIKTPQASTEEIQSAILPLDPEPGIYSLLYSRLKQRGVDPMDSLSTQRLTALVAGDHSNSFYALLCGKLMGRLQSMSDNELTECFNQLPPIDQMRLPIAAEMRRRGLEVN